MTEFCTIARATQLPHARVVADGLALHHPGSRLHVLVLDGRAALAGDEPFELVDMPLGEAQPLRHAERWADLTLVLRPRLVLHLLEHLDAPAIYLDVCADLLDPLAPILAALGHGHAAVVPRVQGDLPDDGLRPTQQDLRRAGRMSGALLAAPPTPGAKAFLTWWAGHLDETVKALPAQPGAAEEPYPAAELSRWLDLAPSTSGDIEVVDDPACAASYWNLHEFDFSERPRLLDFEGFDPERPYVLSPNADRVLVSDNPALGELCESYAERLVARGWGDLRRRDMVGRELPNGMTFDDRLSHLHEEAMVDGAELGDVFTAEGAERFVEWMRSPAPRGGQVGITRYVGRVYRERVDVMEAYPDLEGADAVGLAGWAWVYGRHEMSIPREFLPPPPEGIDVGPEEEEQEAPPPSVNVSGYLGRTLGLGQAARAYVTAVEAAGLPLSTTSVDPELPVDKSSLGRGDGYGTIEFADVVHPGDARFNIICVNADELPRFAAQVGEEFFRDRFSIGVWAWETDYIPDRWKGAFELLDEIWVYSRYVAENLARVAPQPVIAIPPPVTAPDPGGATVNLVPDDGFLFLFMFDFFSTVQRKNPVGLVRAFMKAFEPGEGPRLLVKTIHGRYRSARLEELRWAARGRPDIHIVDLSLPPDERDALLASCDCYVSLHRSEGFGLPLAECMALGKPVIATGFSGNTDFMTVGNSYLVDYGMTHVGADAEIYPAEGTWAEPDLDHAAEVMRHVWENQDEARARGERARREIEANYSPAAVGALVEDRLRRLDRPQPPEPEPGPVRRYSSLIKPKNGLASRLRVATARSGRRTSRGR